MARQMKDSGIEWIGEIPVNWGIHTASQLFSQVKNKNEDMQENNLLSLSYGRIIKKNINATEGLLPESFEGYNIIEPNDIVLRLTDLQNDHTSLRVGISGQRGIITSAYITLHNESDCVERYLYYQLHAFDICKGFYGMGAGVRQGLNWDGIKMLKLVRPAVAEQHRIAAFLDRQCAEIDAVIERTKATIEEYKKLKQAVITEAVTKGVRGTRKMKDSGIEWIGKIPEEWEVRKLGRFIDLRSGITLGKSYPKGTELIKMPYLRVANVKADGFALEDVATIEVTADEAEKYALKAGELLMTEGGDRDKLGRGTVWHGEISPCLHQNHVFAATCDEQWLLTQYLAYLTASNVGRQYFDITAKKTTNLACTNSNTILQFKIPLPSISEQKEIIEWLPVRCEELDTLITKKTVLLTELETYKKSLIYEYVTGKKVVE